MQGFLRFGFALTLVAAGMQAGPARAFSTGPPNLRDGCRSNPCASSAFCSTCRACHSGSNGAPPTALELLGTPAEYTPDMIYDFMLRVADGEALKFGFELSTQVEADQCQAGTLATVSPNTTKIDTDTLFGSGVDFLKHSMPQARSAAGDAIWEFMWTAPPAGTGDVRIWYCANAASGTGDGNANDDIVCDSLLLPEATGGCAPLQSSAPTGAAADCGVDVSWPAAAGGEPPYAYDLEASVDGGAFAGVPGCTGLAATSCRDTSIPWMSSVVYRVRASDSCPSGTQTATSAESVAIVMDQCPEPECFVRRSGTDILVAWDGPADAYDIYRGPLDRVGEIVTSTGAYQPVNPANDCGVPPSAGQAVGTAGTGTSIFYLVVPVVGGGDGPLGCVDRDADPLTCDQPRLPPASPCP